MAYPPVDSIAVAQKVVAGEPLLPEDWTYIHDRWDKADDQERLLLGGPTARKLADKYRIEPPVLQSKEFADKPVMPEQDDEPTRKALAALFVKQAKRVLDRLDELDPEGKSQKDDKPGRKLRVEDIIKLIPDAELGAWLKEVSETVTPAVGKRLIESGFEAMVRARTAARRAIGNITFSLRNTRARDYMADAERRIGRDAVTTGWRETIRETLVRSIEGGESVQEAKRRLKDATTAEIAGYKSERIVRTELAYAHTNGVELGWMESGVVTGKQFVLAADACPWCQAVADELGDGIGDLGDSKTFQLGKPFFDVGKRIEAEFDAGDGEVKKRTMILDYAPTDAGLSVPPVHPNCRCSTRPVLADA